MAGIKTIEPGYDDVLRGALFETYVAQNLAAIIEAHVPDAQLSFWNEQGRHEVDFVIELERKVFAIEVKACHALDVRSDLSGLRAFLERTPACMSPRCFAYNGEVAVKLSVSVYL